MMSPKVSIVIPIYNVDRELFEKCVQSVLEQSYGNFELILVNDGSTDGSGELCDAFAEKDPRIQVVHQENQGVSVARNNGTVCAGGEYVMYVDGDDLLAPYALEEGLAAAEDTGADMVMAGIVKINCLQAFQQYVDGVTNEYRIYHADELELLRRHYMVGLSEFRTIKGSGYINRGPYARLIRAEKAKCTLFPKGLPLGEDVLWNMTLLNKCERVCVVNNIWYGYLLHGASAVRKFYGNRDDIAERYLKQLWDENTEFFQAHLPDYVKNMSTEFYCILNYELLSAKCTMTKREKKDYVRKLASKKPWNLLFDKNLNQLLPLSYKVLLSQCRSGLWIELLTMKKRLSR